MTIKITGLMLLVLAGSAVTQTAPNPQKDSATFDDDGTAHITRVVPTPTTVSPEART